MERGRTKRRERSRSKSDSDSRSKTKSHKKHKSRRHETYSSDEDSRTEMSKRSNMSKEERRKQKELMKTLETVEEKRARRLEKKIAKAKKVKEEMGWDEEYLGYTNADNPFGDENLLDTFVWHKKLESEGQQEIDKKEIEKAQKRQRIENKQELEKVKQRQLEYERRRAECELEQKLLQNDKEAKYHQVWEKQENKFHMEQAKLRSQCRIQNGRAQPIDLFVQYINLNTDDDLGVEMHEPHTFLHGLTIQNLEDLLVDIKNVLEIEEGKNSEFWQDVTIMAEEELNKLRKVDPTSREFIGDRRSGINQAVEDDVANIFKAKTMVQLLELEKRIHEKLNSKEITDVGYWESLFQRLKVHMARQRLYERHEEALRRKLFRMRQEQGIDRADPLIPAVYGDDKLQPGANKNRFPDENKEEEDEDEIQYLAYEAGSYSPKLISFADLPPDTLLIETEEALKSLELARHRVAETGMADRDEGVQEFIRIASAGMNEEEGRFGGEVSLRPDSHIWSDKYRPRKPRYFNRVHTGFVWNKYNQTHYDLDNPPPKIVQGYKFNIFYPDLIDTSDTPTYSATPMKDNEDFATLRFHAGAPYEDIAFKIVNREWEHSHRFGFRSQFNKNILQLHFSFKRLRYRR